MRTNQSGISLIELVVFIAIVGIALVAILNVFNQSIRASVDPMINIKGIEMAQAQLDRVLARKFDANTPTGGVPACGSAEPGAVPCAGIVPDTAFDDVGDFNGDVLVPEPGYTLTTQVVEAGAEIGLANPQARRITVQVDLPGGESIQLSAYKVNF
ncbi:type IV pilus modification PilV family protein [Simiduia agarivorans]|uniref:MSHA pilin protein MshD n=1 Tax=Simiduia agarivorans (strain DSM 21679 / JCM 13881 / BCRC 17597 / SA1) TaxID=1117647 RepID=K4KIM6_SIMAS|nr:type II secretion system protein [Simiduia agarivorans]AFU98050.1 hypothetical protein M5M_04215 [Simiduia agarivorans SA1 = DSM 21679]